MGTDITRRVDEIQDIFNKPVDIFVPLSCFFFKARTTTVTEQYIQPSWGIKKQNNSSEAQDSITIFKCYRSRLYQC
jgi:hypothetical protein